MANQIFIQPLVENSTQKKVIDLISWSLNVPSHHIHPYTRLRDDLHLDAIDVLLLIVDLESRFNVYLTPEEVAGIETVRDASRYLHQYAA
ncbi:MAG: acyl carrier protein [Bacteroidota bacterium]